MFSFGYKYILWSSFTRKKLLSSFFLMSVISFIFFFLFTFYFPRLSVFSFLPILPTFVHISQVIPFFFSADFPHLVSFFPLCFVLFCFPPLCCLLCLTSQVVFFLSASFCFFPHITQFTPSSLTYNLHPCLSQWLTFPRCFLLFPFPSLSTLPHIVSQSFLRCFSFLIPSTLFLPSLPTTSVHLLRNG